MNGSPIYDIKPYLPYCDSPSGGGAGFSGTVDRPKLQVETPPALLERFPEERREKPSGGFWPRTPGLRIRTKPDRVYGMEFAGFEDPFQGGRKTADGSYGGTKQPAEKRSGKIGETALKKYFMAALALASMLVIPSCQAAPPKAAEDSFSVYCQ